MSITIAVQTTINVFGHANYQVANLLWQGGNARAIADMLRHDPLVGGDLNEAARTAFNEYYNNIVVA